MSAATAVDKGQTGILHHYVRLFTNSIVDDRVLSLMKFVSFQYSPMGLSRLSTPLAQTPEANLIVFSSLGVWVMASLLFASWQISSSLSSRPVGLSFPCSSRLLMLD